MVSVYQNAASYAIKTDGTVMGVIGSQAASEADWVALTLPAGYTASSIGNLAGNTLGAGEKLPIILSNS